METRNRLASCLQMAGTKSNCIPTNFDFWQDISRQVQTIHTKETMSELFDIPESKSPRLLWLEKHRIRIIDNGTDYEDGDECEFSGNQLYRFCAHELQGDGDPIMFFDHLTGWGHTFDDAIFNLAKKLKIPLWNEPQK